MKELSLTEIIRKIVEERNLGRTSGIWFWAKFEILLDIQVEMLKMQLK